MKHRNSIVVLFVAIVAVALVSLIAQEAKIPGESDQENDVLISLGINNNNEVTESSGLAWCTLINDSIWTLNDSGQTNELMLLKTDGTLQAKVKINDAKNVDWEAMAGFQFDGKPHLIIGDVGDNLKRRESYQIHLLREPDLTATLESNNKTPLESSSTAITIQFTYEDGPKNCEAIGVDEIGNQIWLVEKVYYDAVQNTPPGIYVLPLSLAANQKPQVAKRIADFPPRNVTGMAFSPDGKRLIIRNYVNAHLYARGENETWAQVVQKTKPDTAVLPIQRQGEAICFTPDSESVIVTSEWKRQPIWQVKLKPTSGKSGTSIQK